MAKVVATFDTVTKEFEFSMGDLPIQKEWIDYMTFEKGYAYNQDGSEKKIWRCRVNLTTKDNEEGIHAYTTICASQKEPLDGIEVTQGEPHIHKSIANLYRSKNGTGSQD